MTSYRFGMAACRLWLCKQRKRQVLRLYHDQTEEIDLKCLFSLHFNSNYGISTNKSIWNLCTFGWKYSYQTQCLIVSPTGPIYVIRLGSLRSFFMSSRYILTVRKLCQAPRTSSWMGGTNMLIMFCIFNTILKVHFGPLWTFNGNNWVKNLKIPGSWLEERGSWTICDLIDISISQTISRYMENIGSSFL